MVAAIVAGRDGTIVHANPAVTSLLGWEPGELTGRPVTALVPRRYLEAHRSAFAAWAADPDARHFDGRYLRLEALTADDDERAIGMVLNSHTTPDGEQLVIGLCRPRDAQHEAVNAVALELVSVLAKEQDVADAVQGLLRAIGEQMDWDAVALWVVDPDREVLRALGMWVPNPDLEEFRAASAEATFGPGTVLPGRVWTSGVPVTIERIEDADEFSRRSAALASGLRTAFAFPMEHGDRFVGVIEMLRSRNEPIDPEHVAVLAGLGPHLGPYLNRVRGRERELRADARQRLTTECISFLSSGIDAPEPLDGVCELLVPDVAEACVIDLVRDGRLERVGAAYDDPQAATDVALLEELVPLETVTAGPMAVIRSGQSAVYEAVTVEELEAGLGGDVPRDLLERLSPQSAIIAPLVGRGSVVGTLTISRRGGRWEDDDRRFAEELGRHLGLALANAALFEREQAVAAALQQSLLPPELPAVPGLDVASRFEPGGAQLAVGGDFYDLFEVEPGTWYAVVGDVCGTGAEAAAVTSQVRYTARALGDRVDGPVELLREVNQALLQRGDSRFCTVLVARVRPGDPDVAVTLASGGHPPPVLISGQGTRLVDCSGTLLGVYADTTHEEVEVVLAPGEALALYTDGVTEARDAGGEQLGEERLVQVLEACIEEDAEKVAEELVQAAVDHSPFGPADDLAVLVLRNAT